MAVFLSLSEKDTFDFAKSYAQALKKGDVVLLYGEMGAGKTVFAKGIAKGLGIKEEILSPTYAYMNEYDDLFCHYDCYRLTSLEQAEGLGLLDYLFGPYICLLEWPENIFSGAPKGAKIVKIKKTGEGREIEYE